MNDIKRLPKGHEVIIEFRPEAVEELCKKVSFERYDDTIFIHGFVSGDTAELGLAVVALDEPEICLIRVEKDASPYRTEIANGYVSENRKKVGTLDIFKMQPTCPY